MRWRLMVVLILLLGTSLPIPQVAAQDGSAGDSAGIPVGVVILLGMLVAGFILRGILRRGNGGYAEEDDDEEDEEEEMLHRHRYHEAEDEELYMLDRDQMWDEDGYLGEDR
jgi:hypothetical protein